MGFRRAEDSCINIPAKHRRLRSRPIGSQQLCRQQRVAQMQAAILVDQQRTHQKAVARLDVAVTLELRLHDREAGDEALVALT
jgi:hypothetical protein